MIAVESGGCAPPIVTEGGTPIADRILEYLRGEAYHDPRQLLREAREEIVQLTFAANCALAAKGA